MAVRKPFTQVFGPATVAAGTTTALTACTATDLTTATQLVVTFRGTFHASATGGARVSLWPSFDGTNWDTSAWANWAGTVQEWAIAVAPGVAVIRTSEPIAPVPKFIRFRIQNVDTVQAITACSLIVTTQHAG